MGIHGLWDVIQSAGESKSLVKYAATQTENIRAQGESRLVRIGVDLSPLMAECIAAASAPSVHGRFTGGEMYILFNKLVSYLHAPAVFVFVLDGDKRPAVKRQTRVIQKEAHWRKRADRLIKCCGYYVHQAPGEAEAELALLNQIGCIDAVISSDSDTLAFGALTLLRSMPRARRDFDDQHFIFTANSIQQSSGLTRGGVILFALLSGGDYGSGLSGFGPSIALILAQAGFGDSLLNATSSLQGTALSSFLMQWRESIRIELTQNPSGRFTRRPPSHLSQLLDDKFPDLNILKLYCQPVITPHSGAHQHVWIHQLPNIAAIGKFCSDIFDWDTPEVLSSKLASRFWGPMFLQLMYSNYCVYDPERKLLATPFENAGIIDFKLVMRQGKFALAAEDEPEAKLTVATTTFLESLAPTFQVDGAAATQSVVVYAPRVMLPPGLTTSSFTKPVSKSVKKRASTKATAKTSDKKKSTNRIRHTAQKTMRNATPGPSSMRNATPGPSSMHHGTPGPSSIHNATPGPSNHASATSLWVFSDDGHDLSLDIEHGDATTGPNNATTGSSDQAFPSDDEFPTVLEMFRRRGKKKHAPSSSKQTRHLGTIDLTVSEEDEVAEPLPTATSATDHHHEYIDLTQSDEENKDGM